MLRLAKGLKGNENSAFHVIINKREVWRCRTGFRNEYIHAGYKLNKDHTNQAKRMESS